MATAPLKRREIAEQSAYSFGMVYLGHYMVNECAEMHKELMHNIELALLPKGRLVGAIPREHSKSTWGTVVTTLFALCTRKKSRVVNKHTGETIGPYIRLWSATELEAKEKLENIKRELETNEKLKADYGEDIEPMRDASGAPVRYNDTGIVLKNGAIVLGKVFLTKVRGAQFRGLRPSIDILDDPEDDLNVENPVWRKKAMKWVNRGILNGLDSETGSLIWLGTILHGDSLLQQLLEPTDKTEKASWIRMVKQAPDPDLPEGPGNELLWPQRWPMDKLLAKKREIGSAAYEQEYRNNPVDPDTQIFKSEYWRYYNPDFLVRDGRWGIQGEPGAKPDWFSKVVMACDPAFGLKKENDWTAITVLGLARGSHVRRVLDGPNQIAALRMNDDLLIYVLALWRDRTSVSGIMRKMEEFYDRWRPSVIGFETVAAQEAAAQQLISNSVLPIQRIKATSSKKERIFGLSRYFENRRVLLPDPAKNSFTRTFTAEAELFPSGKNDDMLDATAQGVEMFRGADSSGVDTAPERDPIGSYLGGF